MVIEEEERWLYNYTMCCNMRNEFLFKKLINTKFKGIFNENYSRERVRDYFFEVHNPQTLNLISGLVEDSMPYSHYGWWHLLIPYVIEDVRNKGLSCVVNEPFYDELPIPLCSRFFTTTEIEKARNLGVLKKELKKGDILLVHALQIVDSCAKKDLKKYKHLYQKQLV